MSKLTLIFKNAQDRTVVVTDHKLKVTASHSKEKGDYLSIGSNDSNSISEYAYGVNIQNYIDEIKKVSEGNTGNVIDLRPYQEHGL